MYKFTVVGASVVVASPAVVWVLPVAACAVAACAVCAVVLLCWRGRAAGVYSVQYVYKFAGMLSRAYAAPLGKPVPVLYPCANQPALAQLTPAPSPAVLPTQAPPNNAVVLALHHTHSVGSWLVLGQAKPTTPVVANLAPVALAKPTTPVVAKYSAPPTANTTAQPRLTVLPTHAQLASSTAQARTLCALRGIPMPSVPKCSIPHPVSLTLPVGLATPKAPRKARAKAVAPTTPNSPAQPSLNIPRSATKPQLVQACTACGLATTGTKAVLHARLVAHASTVLATPAPQGWASV